MFNTTKVQAIFACIYLLILIAIIASLAILYGHWRNKAREIVQKKCQEYVKFACDHQQNKTLSGIVNGDDAIVGMFPHMAFVMIFSKNDPFPDEENAQQCGGSLISEYFVLSAAHCSLKVKNPTGKVKLGSVFSDLKDNTGEVFDVKDIHVYPTYAQARQISYDILLLKLDRKVNFSSNMRPICLNTKFIEDKYSSVIVAGWGRTESGPKSSRLQKIELRTDGEIKKKCDHRFLYTGLQSEQSLMCAGSPDSAKTVNFGDSGGPTKIPLENTCPNVYEQIAIAVAMEEDAKIGQKGILSFHLTLEIFIPWIASVVWPDEF